MRISFMSVIFLFLAQVCFAQDQPQSATEQYGNDIITIVYKYDTIPVEDPETGEIMYKIIRMDKRDLFNGEKIYYDEEATQPIGAASQSTLKVFLTNFLGEDIVKFEKEHGTFSCAIIIDPKGEVAFLQSNRHTRTAAEAREEVAKYKEIEKKLGTLKFIPASKDGKAVYYGLSISAD